MATTNNAQGDESWPTALERQVQTLTAVVERLTKQNNDMEEQLCQRNVGHNTQEEDQEGISTDKRYQEGGRKVAMPLADQNDQTWVIHLPQTWLHPTLLQICRWWGNRWIWWWTPSEDEYRVTSTTWSTKPIHHSPHPSIPSPYRWSFKCCRWRTMTETRTLWITWNLSRA